MAIRTLANTYLIRSSAQRFANGANELLLKAQKIDTTKQSLTEGTLAWEGTATSAFTTQSNAMGADIRTGVGGMAASAWAGAETGALIGTAVGGRIALRHGTEAVIMSLMTTVYLTLAACTIFLFINSVQRYYFMLKHRDWIKFVEPYPTKKKRKGA